MFLSCLDTSVSSMPTLDEPEQVDTSWQLLKSAINEGLELSLAPPLLKTSKLQLWFDAGCAAAKRKHKALVKETKRAVRALLKGLPNVGREAAVQVILKSNIEVKASLLTSRKVYHTCLQQAQSKMTNIAAANFVTKQQWNALLALTGKKQEQCEASIIGMLTQAVEIKAL